MVSANQLLEIYSDAVTNALSVLAIIVGTLLIWRLVRRAAAAARQRFLALQSNAVGNPQESITAAQRLTALQLVVNGTRYALFVTALVLILNRLDVLKSDSLILPAGFFGAALGLGAQNLVRDVVAGLFIVFEGQFAVGDQVKINGVAGRVEEVGLRVTSLRDDAQQLHFFPNGAITTVARFPRQANELWLWVVLREADQKPLAQTAIERALADFGLIFTAWHAAPQLLGDETAPTRLRYALSVVPAQSATVREKLPTRVTQALEAIGLKNESGAMVEVTAAPL